jgi:Rad3-related DNA helicase
MSSYLCPKCNNNYSVNEYKEDRFCPRCGTHLKEKKIFKSQNWMKLFPYEPYPQQVGFMKDVQSIVGNGEVLITEACNGFGKTVSCLSALLTMNKTIIYATRTHEQVRQVLTELGSINQKSKKTFKAVNLASRRHLCINPECKNLPQYEAQETCQSLRKNEECPFNSVLEEPPKKLPPILGKEVLIQEGRKRNICPYYLSRRISKYSHVVVAPYPYVFNPMIRLTTGLHLDGKILILDEGHNIDQVGQDVLSDSLSERGISTAIEELRLVGKSTTYMHRLKEFVHNQNTETARSINPDTLERDIELALDLDINGFMDLHAPLVETIKTKKMQSGNPPVSYLNGILGFMELLQSSQKDKYIGLFTRNYYGANIVEYRCLDPSLAVKPLIEESEGVLIMSGTLSPLDLFAEIIGQSGAVKRSYPSIQNPKNVKMVIDTGVTTAYKMRTEPMITRIGRILEQELSDINKGALIFFTQRGFMNTCLDLWINKGIIKRRSDRLHFSGKILYREGRDAKQNRKVVERYKRMTTRIKGAVLCCVFRGRNSEGSNFPDDEARGILLVGVPYANYSDPIVKAQIRYFNKIKRGLGHRWYTMDAFRVANQSLGRGIRGRDDWCHYWLLDRRYAEQENLISPWAKGEGPEIKWSNEIQQHTF